MTLDKSGAAEALAEIGQSQRRSAQLYSYSVSAPYLFLTGAMWLIADLAFEYTDIGKYVAWPFVTFAAIPIFVAIAIYQSRRRTPKTGARLDTHFWKGMALWLLAFLFVTGTFVIFAPIDGIKVHSFIGLAMGVVYAAMGLWMGRRMLIMGFAIIALTALGHFFIHEHYVTYMGVVGGGGMMLGALWLRRV